MTDRVSDGSGTIRGVARFQAKYSDDQRQAILDAILERGMTAPQAIAAASEGTLGVPPFRMPLGTAQDIAGRARREREPNENGGIEQAVHDVTRRGVRLVELEVRDLEKLSKSGEGAAPRASRRPQRTAPSAERARRSSRGQALQRA